jgi:two-component system cell cycle sensor histidine kinase/response regulator CckA
MSLCSTLQCIARAGWCSPSPRGFKAIRGRLVAALLLLAGPVALRGAERPSLRIGLEAQAEPLSFVQADGVTMGFSADLARAVAREMSVELQPVTAPWTETYQQLLSGKLDVLASVAYSKERDAVLDFTVPYLLMHGALFVRRDDRSIQAPSDLATRRIAHPNGSFSHEYLKAQGWAYTPVFVATLTEAFEALETGRCDAVPAVRIVGNHVIRTQGFTRIVASGVALPDYTFRLAMAVRAGDADRLALLNEGLARIRANGTYDQVHERWIGPLEPRRLRWHDLQPALLPLLIIALAVGGTLWWQRRLLGRLAEQAAQLRASEGRLQRVLEGSEDGFWDWDMATGRFERSERWAAMLGYRLDEIAPTLEAGAALVHPEDQARHETWQTRLTSPNNDRRDLEYRMRTKSGEWRWILDRGKVVARGPDGRPTRMAGTHTDITTRKQTEAALIESQALLKRSAQLLEQTQSVARIGGWETDLRTGCIYWTAETYRLHETTPAEFTPTRKSVYAFFTPPSRDRLAQAVEQAVREAKPYSLELEITTARQHRRLVHVAGLPELENGRVVKLFGSCRDLTAERQAEEERESLRAKMVETQKLESLGVLAGGIAHDFNNLLTVILANASFVRDTTVGNDVRLDQIEVAARRAADLCRQMLAYAGKSRVIVEPLDLGALVRDTLELIQVSTSKKARLHLELADNLPFVDADASQVRQILISLVTNASEALPDGAGDIRIATRLARPRPDAGVCHSFDLPVGPCVCMEVSDTGHGMTAATLARIFDPFFTTKFTGRGLGLAAVLGIVRTHQGALTVDSAPERGSTFRLHLPVSRTTPPSLELALSATTKNPPGGTVLIADDEPVVLNTTSALLRHRGFETVLAVDGHDAVRQFRASPGRFTAVLLDLSMPGLGGAEALRVIRSVDSSVPALVMSGFSEQDVFDRVRGLGRVAVVRKPFTQEMLLSRMAEVTPN